MIRGFPLRPPSREVCPRAAQSLHLCRVGAASGGQNGRLSVIVQVDKMVNINKLIRSITWKGQGLLCGDYFDSKATSDPSTSMHTAGTPWQGASNLTVNSCIRSVCYKLTHTAHHDNHQIEQTQQKEAHSVDEATGHHEKSKTGPPRDDAISQIDPRTRTCCATRRRCHCPAAGSSPASHGRSQ